MKNYSTYTYTNTAGLFVCAMCFTKLQLIFDRVIPKT